MDLNNCFYIGAITKKFSYKGEVMAYIESQNSSQFKVIESVFLEISQGELIPFFIESLNFKPPNLFRFKFEDVDNDSDAAALIGKKIYLSNDFLPEMNEMDFFLHQIKGYNSKDINRGILGEIKNINSNSPQHLFEIENENQHKILIPVVQELIHSIDHENKTIVFKCPDGLLDLFK